MEWQMAMMGKYQVKSQDYMWQIFAEITSS